MTRAMIVTTGGKVHVTDIPSNEGHRLATYQSIVGGYLEAIPVSETVHAFVNEEANLHRNQFPPNRTATAMIGYGQMILGDVLFVSTDAEGESIDLDQTFIADQLNKGYDTIVTSLNQNGVEA